jgi:hypothetical protein
MWVPIAKYIGGRIVVPILIAVTVDLILDKYRKPKAQVHFKKDER